MQNTQNIKPFNYNKWFKIEDSNPNKEVSPDTITIYSAYKTFQKLLKRCLLS